MRGLGTVDYVILAAYLVASIVLGLRFARGQRNLEDYFVAERAAPWWVAGISIIASDFSAISYIGAPAWVFRKDLQYGMGIFLFPLFMLPVIHLFVPFLARLRLLTVYEYLEHRFGVAPRTFASGLFLLMRGGHLANAIWAQALVLAGITQLSPRLAVVAVGGITCVYTVFGGMKAVLWTDFMQFFVLVGGILAMLIAVLVAFNGSIVDVWNVAAAGGHTKMVSFSLDPKLEVTVWGLALGLFVITLSAHASDQVIVQRYFTTGSRKEMARAIMFGGIVVVPVVVALYLAGLGMAAFYATNTALASTLKDPQQVVPHFVTHVLPTGVAGLVIAGLFAATMSSMSAGFNSLSTATIVDFFLRFRRGREGTDASNLLAARLGTLAWGVGCSITALYLNKLGDVIEIMGKINGFLSGPLIGMFLLGVLTRRANAVGVLTGAIVGTAVTWWASTTGISWLWYGPVGCVVTLVAGALASLVRPAPPAEEVLPLTLRGGKHEALAR